MDKPLKRIINTVKEEIMYHKRSLSRSENLLLLLKGNLSALYDKDVNGATMTWQYAKEHIELFQQIIKKEEDVAPF